LSDAIPPPIASASVLRYWFGDVGMSTDRSEALANSAVARARRPRRRDGFILVAVLWIVAALATLAIIDAAYVISAAPSFRIHEDRLQKESLIKAALELTAFQMTATTPAPSMGNFEFAFEKARGSVEFRSEAARIDLNFASKELLTGLFTALGTKREIADGLATRIVAWRTPREQRDPEITNYRRAERAYRPRGGPFPHTQELSLVLGFSPEFVKRVLPFVTVYSGQAEINVMAAEPQVLAAIPGMTHDRLAGLLAHRRGRLPDPVVMNALLGPLQDFATTQSGRTVRVNASVQLEDGRVLNSEVVIFMVRDGADPYRILSWQDDLDEGVLQ